MKIGRRDAKTLVLAINYAILEEEAFIDAQCTEWQKKPDAYRLPKVPARGNRQAARQAERNIARFKKLKSRLLKFLGKETA